MNNIETIINYEPTLVQKLDKIVVMSGELKYYLADELDRDRMNLDQFTESVFDLHEFHIENNNHYFKELHYTRTEKIIGINTQNFEYAASVRDKELNILYEIIDNDIAEMFFVTYKNIGYYLVYVN
jgi:hypothetical protein